MAKYTSFLAGATLAKHTDLNRAISAGKPVGLLNNADVSIENGVLSIGPHEVIFPNGVFSGEDEITTVTTPAPTAAPTNYTVVQRLDPGLFSMPVLDVIKGTYTQNQVTDYAVIGWIYYPGLSLSMSTEMFVRAPRAGAPATIADFDIDELYRKLAAAYGATSGLEIERTRDGRVKLASATDAAQSIVVPFTIQVADDVVQSLLVDVQLSAQALISWSRITCDDSGIITETAIPYAGLNGELSRSRMLLPFARQAQTAWSSIALELTIALGPGASMYLARVSATSLATASTTKL